MNHFLNYVLGQIRGSSREAMAWNRSYVKESLEQQRVLQQPWENFLVTAVDSETTGFYPERGDEIISIAGVRWKGSILEPSFHSYVKIEGTLPSHIIDLTGITEADLEQAPAVQEVLLDFLKFVDSTVLIGYYIGHDIRFFNYFLWKKLRMRFKTRVLELKTVIDLLYPELGPLSFDQVCSYFGIIIRGRHTAIGDAGAVSDLWSQLVKSMDQKGIRNLADLYERLALFHRNQ